MANFKQDKRGKNKCTEETKKKISNTLTGRKLSMITKEKISKSLKGRKYSYKKRKCMQEFTKEKIRLSLMGKRNLNNRSTVECNYIFCKYHNIEKIPNKYVIHHIDGNFTNNKINNLELMKDINHRRMHAKKQKLGKHIRKLKNG